ncbi:TPA: hypothetical protein VDT14_003570 [Pseudomonas aeruginosa]|nr:hypothetical protein [Pseudomonas aeruginosa]
MTRIGTPLSPSATRVLLCGSGELGKEVAIELLRESEINQKGKARKLWDIEEGKGI